ncbi:hypothetical protein [Phaffia rhodozyma]|uniref:Uncharacterized protein n=1 Tax=Phaffia rhodozyma TaxID=264483 RepID=A0A0F7SE40_PHARH|nr:hypothetical protein [Phaffia rhodozyma]
MPIEIPQLNLSGKNFEHPIANTGPPSKTTSAYVISSLLQPPRRNAQLHLNNRLTLDQHAQPWFSNALGWDTVGDQSSRKPSQRLTNTERRTNGAMDDEVPRQIRKARSSHSITAKGKERQIDDEYYSGDQSEGEDEDEEEEWFERDVARRASAKKSYREQLKAQTLDFLRNPDPRYYDLPNSELLKTILHSATHYYTSQSPPLLDELGYNQYLAHMARLARHANKQTRRRRRLRRKQFAQGGGNFGQDGQDEEDGGSSSSSSSSSSESYSSSSASSSTLSSSGSSFSSRLTQTSKALRRTRSQSTVAETSKSCPDSTSDLSRPPSRASTKTKGTPRTLPKSIDTDDCDPRMSGTRGKKPRLASGMKKVVLRDSAGPKKNKKRRTRWRAVSKLDMHKSLDGDSLIALGILLEEHVRHQVLTRSYSPFQSALSPTPEPTQSSSPPSFSHSDGGESRPEGTSKEGATAEEGDITGTESANSDVFDMRDSDTE